MNMNTLTLEGNTPEIRSHWLKNLLHSGTYEITFTKVNGETRIMPCTLDSTKIPPAPVKEQINKTEKVQNPNTLRVWCTDKQEWRSFRVMSILGIKETTNGN
jgi:hypothetical protein